jgi:serine/threonine-protein kinase ATR
VLDYLALWLQEKRKVMSDARIMAGKTGRGISEIDEIESIKQFSAVESLLRLIPAKVISKRAVECRSYARALFHWEQYYREEQHKSETSGEEFIKDDLLQHLQHIYAQIDEPDSIEGISAHLLVLNPEQQIMEHRKAGRWTAAQTWYELALAEKPNDSETQINLLTCLKESGQYGTYTSNGERYYQSNFGLQTRFSTMSTASMRLVLLLRARCPSPQKQHGRRASGINWTGYLPNHAECSIHLRRTSMLA